MSSSPTGPSRREGSPSASKGFDSGLTWVPPLLGILAYDAALVYSGRQSLSAQAMAHPYMATAGVVYLGLHLVGRRAVPAKVAKWDPLVLAIRYLGPAEYRH